MPLRNHLKVSRIRTLTMFLLLILISACGSNTTVQGGGTPPSPGNSSTPGNQNGPSPTATSVGPFDIPGLLHIQTGTASFSCSPDFFFSISNPAALVLATNNLTYQSAEIQQMEVYSTAVFHGTQSSVSMPTTLSFVPGSPSANLSMWNDSSSDCSGGFQITNISNSTIQLSQISMEYTAASQPNNYSYRLLNICSLLTTQSDIQQCPPPRGGGGSGYYYQFQLQPGSANTEIPGQQTDAGGQPISVGPTLDPGAVAFLNFSFLPSGTPSNFVYSVRPKLTLDVVGEQRSIELSQLDSTLAFADTSQFSCYTLQGDTFTQLSTAKSDSVWCV